jgi:hypothetical protein
MSGTALSTRASPTSLDGPPARVGTGRDSSACATEWQPVPPVPKGRGREYDGETKLSMRHPHPRLNVASASRGIFRSFDDVLTPSLPTLRSPWGRPTDNI